MNMTGMQRRALQEALIAAFPTEGELANMIDVRLDENLAAIAGGGPLSAVVFNLITWAVSRGKDEALLKAALAENPGAPGLRAFAQQMGFSLPVDSADASTAGTANAPHAEAAATTPPPAPAYLDFDLEIGPGSGQDYPVAVLRSPAGEARETMRFPYDDAALDAQLQGLEAGLRSSTGRGRMLPDDGPGAGPVSVRDFGQALFQALFTGELRSRYDVSRQSATAQDRGLRLRLRIGVPKLAALPWEFLYDPRYGEYLCLSSNTPLMRYLELPQPIQPLAVRPPLRILGMVASPTDLPRLDVAQEQQRVEAAIADLRARKLVDLTWLAGQTWRDLQRALRTGRWHIFHFIGHGGFDSAANQGLLAFSGDDGRQELFSSDQLGRLLADHATLRLALLNSCQGAEGSPRDVFAATASTLVRRGIPAVVGMQYPISDRAAIEFSRSFYEALADGLPVDAAVTEARKAVSFALRAGFEWGTPVLHMRSPDGVLLNIAPPARPG